MRALTYIQLSLISALAIILPNMVRAEPLPEHVLRAAYLYNFAQLTEWPKNQNSPIRYCFFRASDYLPETEILKTKSISGRAIIIQQIENSETAKDCDALVIGSQERYPTDQMISAVANQPVLTILSEHTDSKNNNSVIQLSADNNRLAFKVNLVAAKEAGLVLSSRLLRVAKTVVQE